MNIKITFIVFHIGYYLCTNALEFRDVENPVFGYISKYGIPAAKRLKRTEDEYLKKGSRIVDGVPSVLGQHPYQAGLISNIINTSERGLCGGSLITTNRILTAAHCWYDGVSQAWMFEVVLGSVLLFSGGTRFNTSTISIHFRWDPSLIRNDIAVIYLPDYVAISAAVAPIALPASFEENEDFVGAEAVASGFGITQDDEYVTTSQILNHVSLRVIKNSVCSISYPYLIQSTHICTSGLTGPSPCRGDSGGPLVANSNGRNVLVGVTSFGSAFGCQSLLPAVYTRVTSYLGFIYRHI